MKRLTFVISPDTEEAVECKSKTKEIKYVLELTEKELCALSIICQTCVFDSPEGDIKDNADKYRKLFNSFLDLEWTEVWE